MDSEAAEAVVVDVRDAAAMTRRDRKKLEKREKQADELRQLTERANQVNCEGDQPFSVTLEADQVAEGSRNITFNKVSVTVSGKTLFRDATVRLSAGSRYGLMGPNGRGKSTILRLLATRELPVQSNLDLLLVEQEQEFTASEVSAVQAVLNSHKRQVDFLAEAAALRARHELGEAEMTRLHFLEEELDIMGAAQAEAKARRILFGLGFPTEWHERPTRSFSGGWRKRIALASAVFIEPDVLMLDEPTNHLDLNAVIWLESYLALTYSETAKRPKTLVVVSHDAGFLDEICTHMIHVENYKLNYYKGAFSSFAEQLQQHHQELDKKYAAVTRTIKDKKRNGMSNAQIDEWVLEQIRGGRLDPQYLQKRRDYVVNFPFADPPQLPDACVCKLEEVAFHYPDGPVLFEGVNCALWTDSRITLCGPNGIGKSTLLNLMTGALTPTHGFVTLNRQVRIGRYNQHFVDKLPLAKTPVEYMQQLGIAEEDKARRQLGSFGLEGVVHKNQIATLSGGQKARVAFAAISAERPHFLLLDEPTNHLDVESIEALCAAIRAFKGGVLVVTHDARLIESTEMQIWVAGNRNVMPFRGGLDEYKAQVRAEFELSEAQKTEERKLQLTEKSEAKQRLRQQQTRAAAVAANEAAVAAAEAAAQQRRAEEQAARASELSELISKRKKPKKSKASVS